MSHKIRHKKYGRTPKIYGINPPRGALGGVGAAGGRDVDGAGGSAGSVEAAVQLSAAVSFARSHQRSSMAQK